MHVCVGYHRHVHVQVHCRVHVTMKPLAQYLAGHAGAVCRSEHALMKRVFEKAHALIKCMCDGGIRNIARQIITCIGTYAKN